MDWSFLSPINDSWQNVLAQATNLTLQDLVQQVDAFQNQLDALQSTNQLLSDSLTQQIEFLRKENQDLTNSFTRYVDAMKWNLTVLAGLAAVLTAVGGWIFKSNLDDAKKVAQEMINQRVEGQISALVDARVEEVGRTIRREQVIGYTYVDYYLPDGNQETPELQLLRARKFKDVIPLRNIDKVRRSPGDVLVLDLQNWILSSGQRFIDLPEEEREAVAKQQIDQLLEALPLSAVMVVYIRGTLKYLYSIHDRYVIAANNPITLVGNTADGAYVALGDRTASR